MLQGFFTCFTVVLAVIGDYCIVFNRGCDRGILKCLRPNSEPQTEYLILFGMADFGPLKTAKIKYINIVVARVRVSSRQRGVT